MAKGKAKTNNSSVSVAPPQPRSLRSRKRECPSDEVPETDGIQATHHHHHQETEGNQTTADATVLQCQHSPLQESTVKAFEEQEETSVTNPSNDSQLNGFKIHADNDANRSGKVTEEMTAEVYNTSPSQICTDQLQVFLQIAEEGDGAAVEDQLGAEENPECDVEKKQEVSQEEPSDVYMTDVKETSQEAAAGLPAKKKRRMGMCGLTERERSHFLQTQKRENGQNGPKRVGKQICDNMTDHQAQEEMISSLSSSLSVPAGSVTEQEKAEMKLQSSHCGGKDRAETEVHFAATTSDGTSVVSDPGVEVEGGIEPSPEQTGDTKPYPPEEEELLGNQDQHERDSGTSEIVAEKLQEQMKDGEDGSAAINPCNAIPFSSDTTQSEETENRDAMEAAPLQVNSATRTREEELTGDAGDDDVAEAGASSTNTQSGGFNAAQLCEAAVTPSGSEMKDNCDFEGKPGAGPSAVNAEPPQTRDTTDPFGSGYLDYVSDSQLNTIIMTEEEVMGREEHLGSPYHEDATDLICGLIRELSSLNRKVMATHRELENLRRSSKSSRGCKR